jgi:hypothetical protein
LHIVLPFHTEVDLTPHHLLLCCAAIAAACLLSIYVGLLHDSVARGVQWRAEQQTAASTRGTNPTPMSTAWAQARKVSGNTMDTAAR